MDWFSLVYEFLKRSDIEGEVLAAYLDTGGVWTIGVGHTGPVDGKKIGKSTKITAEKSRELLKEDIKQAAEAVDTLVHTKRPLSAHQKAALVSFVFNVGRNAFAGSTMLRLLNSNQFDAAALQFARWNKDNGVVLRGLVNRRAYEKQMFLTAD